MAAAGTIAVYGATGYTGRLVAREAARRELPLVLSGRDAARLHAVAEELQIDAPVRAAALDDRDALRHALGDCATVINCAGPFTRLGEPVVRAAVETGTHYADTTGEQPFMQRVFERYDDAARAAEVAVVPAVGFDYLPGDLICRLAATGHEPLRELVLAYAVKGFAATRGTLHSALLALRGGDLAYEGGEWRPAGPGPLRAAFTFPDHCSASSCAPRCGRWRTPPSIASPRDPPRRSGGGRGSPSWRSLTARTARRAAVSYAAATSTASPPPAPSRRRHSWPPRATTAPGC